MTPDLKAVLAYCSMIIVIAAIVLLHNHDESHNYQWSTDNYEEYLRGFVLDNISASADAPEGGSTTGGNLQTETKEVIIAALDLREQQKMAEATIQLARDSEFSLWISFFGFLAVVAALGFNFFAVRAQNSSTRTMVLAERAILNIVSMDFGLNPSFRYPTDTGFQSCAIKIQLSNIGRTAAKDITAKYKLIIVLEDYTRLNIPEIRDPKKSILDAIPSGAHHASLFTAINAGDTASANAGSTMAIDTWEKIKASEAYVYIYGGINFTDVFDIKRSVDFGYRFDADSGAKGRLRKLRDRRFWYSDQ